MRYPRLHRANRFFGVPFLVALLALPVFAQIVTQLKPDAVKGFDRYAGRVERETMARWHSGGSFLSIDEKPEIRQKVLAGELNVTSGSSDNPISIRDGLVHDWIGDVFLPNVTPEQVVHSLVDFDSHHKFYPDVIRSKTLQSAGSHVTGSWRLQKKSGILGTVLDVTIEAEYQQIRPGDWVCRSHFRSISEVKNAGTRDEVHLQPGHDQGFLWQMVGLWGLEKVKGGVLAECRTVSLSRDVPFGLSFAVKPFLRDIPMEEMTTSLRGVKAATSQ